MIDDTFQKYCSGEDKNCILYWQQYCLNHPEQAEMILKAKRLYQILVGNRKSIHEQMERLKTDLKVRQLNLHLSARLPGKSGALLLQYLSLWSGADYGTIHVQ
ncbi:hypothetical protein KUH03_07210 [Sphingobacterium sp. E70]|uniref:hypothetical protein n=1 Tax=Sphingobacterium sp. E70 TaxID=2853439 RepID=UPI00211BF4FA|nr:hypothetical protein [Sphingobacterium sp. E70]ULT26627.1 hypothetical protein KUH03_07210 [Sphingobacterium sp. E70]